MDGKIQDVPNHQPVIGFQPYKVQEFTSIHNIIMLHHSARKTLGILPEQVAYMDLFTKQMTGFSAKYGDVIKFILKNLDFIIRNADVMEKIGLV